MVACGTSLASFGLLGAVCGVSGVALGAPPLVYSSSVVPFVDSGFNLMNLAIWVTQH